MVELVYKFDKKSYHECLIAKVRFKYYFLSTNIYTYLHIYGHQPQSLISPLELRMRFSHSDAPIGIAMAYIKFSCLFYW